MAINNYFSGTPISIDFANVKQIDSKPAASGFTDGNIIFDRTEQKFYQAVSGSWILLDFIGDDFTVNKLAFNTSATETLVTGELAWNEDDETVDMHVGDAVTIQLGQEMVYHVVNQTGSQIDNGTVVMANGALGASGKIKVVPAIADGSVPAKHIMGVATEDIPNGALGYVTAFGKVRGFNTSSYSSGTVLYASATSSGSFTDTAPSLPNQKVTVAITLDQKSNGNIFVRPTYDDRRKSVSSISDLENVNTTENDVVYLDAGGRSGWFKWNGNDDLSTQVSNDTGQGIYVAPSSNATGASGAWVRDFSGPINVKWFGAVSDYNTSTLSGTDNTSAFNNFFAFTFGDPAYEIPPGKYKIGSSLNAIDPTGGSNFDRNIFAHSAELYFSASSGYMFHIDQGGTQADASRIRWYGGRYVGNSNATGAFKLDDVNSSLWQNMIFEDWDNSSSGYGFHIRNVDAFSENNKFDGIQFANVNRMWQFAPASVTGGAGTASFARTRISNVFGAGGEYWIACAGGVYDSFFSNIVGNVAADTSAIVFVSGAMGGTVIDHIAVERAGGSTAYAIEYDSASALAGTPWIGTIDAREMSGTINNRPSNANPYVFYNGLEVQGGDTPHPKRETVDYYDAEAVMQLYGSSNDAGAEPFDQFRNQIIQLPDSKNLYIAGGLGSTGILHKFGNDGSFTPSGDLILGSGYTNPLLLFDNVRVWTDANDNIRYKTSAPSSNTDGEFIGFQKLFRASTTITNGNSFVTVTHNFGTASVAAIATVSSTTSPEALSISNKNTTSLRVNRSGTSGDLDIDVIVVVI